MLRDMHSKQIEKGECSYTQGDTHTQLSSLEATGHAQDLKRVEKREGASLENATIINEDDNTAVEGSGHQRVGARKTTGRWLMRHNYQLRLSL